MSGKRVKDLKKASKEIAETNGIPGKWKKIYRDLKSLTKNKFLSRN